jgi:predicted DNA-binding protein
MSDILLKCPTYMKDSRITIRVSSDLRRRLKAAARQSGKCESDIVRGVVEKTFAVENPSTTAYERVKRAGLIGIVRNADRDLSTNPRYFDGFGKS